MDLAAEFHLLHQLTFDGQLPRHSQINLIQIIFVEVTVDLINHLQFGLGLLPLTQALLLEVVDQFLLLVLAFLLHDGSDGQLPALVITAQNLRQLDGGGSQ